MLKNYLDDATKEMLARGIPMELAFGLKFDELNIFRGLAISPERDQGLDPYDPVHKSIETTLGEGMYTTPDLSIARKYAEYRSTSYCSISKVGTYGYKDINLVSLLSQDAVDRYMPEYVEYVAEHSRDREWAAGFLRAAQEFMAQKKLHPGNLQTVARDGYINSFFSKKGFDGLIAREGGEGIGSGIGDLTTVLVFDPKAKLTGVKFEPVSPAIDFGI